MHSDCGVKLVFVRRSTMCKICRRRAGVSLGSLLDRLSLSSLSCPVWSSVPQNGNVHFLSYCHYSLGDFWMGGLEALKKRRDFTFDNLLIKLLVLSLPRFFLMACNNLPCRKIIYCFLNRLSFHDFFIFLCRGSVQLIRIIVCSYKDKWCSLCSNFFFPPIFFRPLRRSQKTLLPWKKSYMAQMKKNHRQKPWHSLLKSCTTVVSLVPL